MTNEPSSTAAATILDNIRGTRDALSVRRVFGDPHEIDGVTIIPVARISGAAGGGGGEGTKDQQTGSGFGTGFGVRAEPVGVYTIRDGEVAWKPTIDITRLARGCQVLAAVIAVCVALVAMRCPRTRPPTRPHLRRHSAPRPTLTSLAVRPHRGGPS
jgi:uncharacterized spore protein YtfJ